MNANEIYVAVAKAIVDDGWSVIKVTRDSVTQHDDGNFPPEVYWSEDSGTEISGFNWELVHEFHSSEYIDEPRHVEYHLEEYITCDVLEADNTLYIVCTEISDLGDSDNPVGWALCANSVGHDA